MKRINAKNLDYIALNELIKNSEEKIEIDESQGQRFIANGLSNKEITINGTLGNASGSFLNGAKIIVNGNGQDAIGDTMNDGEIIINGNVGDAVGYAMRGGKIFIKGKVGYRAGIHMKEYKEKKPILVVGETAGSFLGEYQAGGIIIVLDIKNSNEPIVSNFACAGMHGGKMLLRSACENIIFPKNVKTTIANKNEIEEFLPYIKEFCMAFNIDFDKIINSDFTIITPDAENPYKQMYAQN